MRIDGTTILEDYLLEYDIATHTAAIRFETSQSFPTGMVNIEFSLDAGASYPVLKTVEAPAENALAVDPVVPRT